MKILSNFDTKLDWKTFLKKVEQYWNYNVLLVKRHPLFLYKAFFNALLGLIILTWIIFVINFQYSEHIEFFYIFLVLHILGIGLWIFMLLKKIILKLFNYKEFITCKEDLAKIDMSEFWTFIKFSIILFLYQFLISVWNIATLFIINDKWTIGLTWWVGIFVLNFLFLVIILRILKRFIDFEMDFIIVTKDEIESFNQSWIFKREIVSLDIRKIRSISTEKDWFFKSLFNIWSLKILSEWDSEHKWEIRFNYIHRLWKLKKAVLDLIQQNKKWNFISDND